MKRIVIGVLLTLLAPMAHAQLLSLLFPINVVSLTQALTPAQIAAGNCVEQTFTVTGLKAGDIVVVNAPAIPGPNIGFGNFRVPSDNTLVVEFCNTDGLVARTPTAQNYSVRAIR